MKKQLFKFAFIASAICSSLNFSAQTPGTLTFTFSEVSKTPTYNGNSQHVLAVWVQSNAGAFVKTKLRYAGNGTSDHLPTWSVNAGGTSGNCLSASANVVDATTGATRASWTTYNVVWDGKMGPTTTGTVQPDGVYKVSIQSTWNHGTGGTATTSYTFTKGPSAYSNTITADPNFGTVYLHWVPTVTTGMETISANANVNVFPNPTNGIFNVSYDKANSIKVTNTLGVVIFEEKLDALSQGTKTIDLNNFANGIYLINISSDEGTSIHKVILNK